MKLVVAFAFCFLNLISGHGQSPMADSLQLLEMKVSIPEAELKKRLADTKSVTDKIDQLGYLAFYYAWVDPVTGITHGKEGIRLAQQHSYKRGEAYCTQSMSFCLMVMGNYNESLRFALKSQKMYEDLKDQRRIAYNFLQTANIYREIGDYRPGIQEAAAGIRINDSLGYDQKVAFAVIGSIYERAGKLDSALHYLQKAYELDVAHNKGQWGWIVYVIGNIHRKMNNEELALSYYRLALPLVIAENAQKDIVDVYNSLSALHKDQGRNDSSISYANQIIYHWRNTSYTQGLLAAANRLASIYKETGREDSLLKFLEMSISLNAELFTAEKEREFQNLAFTEEMRRQENENARMQNLIERRKNLQLLFIAAFIITFAIAIILMSKRRTMLKPARFLALIALLLIFEFISLLAHPLIAKITHHEPIWTLLILVLLASLLVPAHHKLEQLIRNKLTRRRSKRSPRLTSPRPTPSSNSSPGSSLLP
jgi:tetratricopeptide (TPR) repeat protein